MKNNYKILTVVVTLVIGTMAVRAESEKDIPLSKVPKNVIAASEKAVPGIKLTEAEVQKTQQGLTYELEGTADGKKYEVRISENGDVLKVTQGDDGEDEKKAASPDGKKDKD